jgi:hypothetical protein
LLCGTNRQNDALGVLEVSFNFRPCGKVQQHSVLPNEAGIRIINGA